jgi:acetyltransferase-like isoleucine patch superfamily enzyme
MQLSKYIKSNQSVKNFVHRLLIPKHQARPRLWVKWFINPFYHKKGKGAIICRRTRVDTLPFQPFKMGAYSTIEDFSTVNNGVGGVNIGHHVRVGMGNVIIGPVTIGNNVIMAQNVVLSGLNHVYTNPDTAIQFQPVTTAEIIIDDDCWIGANVVITAGVSIGKHSVVAGGSVVTKAVPPYTIVGGNPAKPLKQFNFSSGQWERVSNIVKAKEV